MEFGVKYIENIKKAAASAGDSMLTIDERLEAIAHNLELVSQMQLRTEQVVNILAEDRAKTERIMAQIAVLVRDHEERLRNLER